MRNFIEIPQTNGLNFYINPDQVQCFGKAADAQGRNCWKAYLVGHATDNPFFIYAEDQDIQPLIDSIRQEPVSYTVPLETLIWPR